ARSTEAQSAGSASASSTDGPAVQVPGKETAHKEEKSSHALKATAVKSEHGKSSGGPGDSGKTYTVGKGDNPVAIAKKLKVSYDELLALNHISDPRKLQIGQKLLVPNKTPKAKKSDE